MFIIEGSDLVGKTTLAQALVAARPDMRYQHFSRLPDSFHRFFDYLPHINAQNIMDRFYMSEPVYAKVRGDTTEQLPVYATALDRECMSAGAVIVVVTADPNVIADRWHRLKRAEMYGLDQILLANRFFEQIATTASLDGHIFHVDYHLQVGMTTAEEDVQQHVQTLLFMHDVVCNRAAYLRSTREFPVVFQPPI